MPPLRRRALPFAVLFLIASAFAVRLPARAQAPTDAVVADLLPAVTAAPVKADQAPAEADKVPAPIAQPSAKDAAPTDASMTDAEAAASVNAGETESMMAQSDQNSVNAGSISSTVKTQLPQADDASGALLYSYPIEVPPGRSGLQPDLALRYSSQANRISGAFGQGWDIGIPAIERTSKQGVDHLYANPTFVSSLSGELVMSASGTYVSRFENGDFLSSTFDGTSWTVKDKKGTTYLFGSASSSRLDDPANAGHVSKWMLSEIRDLNDNYIKYEYFKDGGQIYPSRIVYTGNGSTDGIFEVAFTREARPDALRQYNAGFLVTTSYRVSEIRTKVNGTWVRKYTLGYTHGAGAGRSLLATVTKSGQDEGTSSIVTLPAQSLSYQSATSSWSAASGVSWPLYQQSCGTTTGPLMFMENIYSTGTRVVDVNGDGLADIELYESSDCTNRAAWINNGDGTGWTRNDAWVLPVPLIGLSNNDYWGAKLADVNGDGLVDLIYSGRPGGIPDYGVYINTGSGWVKSVAYVLPEDPLNSGNPLLFVAGGKDQGVRIMDVNGDGLADILQHNGYTSAAWTNKGDGTGWVRDDAWVPPAMLGHNGTDTYGTQFEDYNGDGLIDFLYGHRETIDGVDTKVGRVFVNNGHGWTQDTGFSFPEDYSVAVPNPGFPLQTATITGTQTGVMSMDVNGDGFGDLVKASYFGGSNNTCVYINRGDGTGWDRDTSWGAPVYFATTNGVNESGVNVADFDGDGLPDLVYSGYSFGTQTHGVFAKNGKVADLLTQATVPQGGSSAIAYKSTAMYSSGGALLSPKLPYALQVVQSVTNDDGFGTTSIVSRSYEGGKSWYGSPLDRRFAGFAKISETDAAGDVKATFFHQGDASATGTGEYLDDVSKIGRAYRLELLDPSGNKEAISIRKWDRTVSGTSTASFVKLARSLDQAFDGNASHKDKVTEYAYDAFGNPVTTTEWGEVSGSDDGTFTDTGSDKLVTSMSYVLNPAKNLYGLPASSTTTDQTGSLARQTNWRYDNNSAVGYATKGSLTKEDRWKSGTTYVSSQKGYDGTYGLVTSDTDPRGKVTTYGYDAAKLYPTTITNPLSQVTSKSYDYSAGQATQVIDPNLLKFATLYDGLDRPLEERQPDQSTTSTQVAKTTYAYGDSALGGYVKKTSWLDGANGVDLWTYLDGFGRPVQTRQEAEATNTYATSDTAYDTRELVAKTSLPYFSTGSSRTTATTDTTLYATNSYDPLRRPASTTNAVGTTSYSYDDWKTTVTDPRGSIKNLFHDAYGRLNRVEEVLNATNTFATTYSYDGSGNLTGLTDASSNVRAFTYDGLGRRLTAQDLHAPADGTFGTWSYTYDDAGNRTSVLSPKSLTVNYVFDDLNRPVNEDYTSSSGTDATYTYDTCQYGKGHVCSAVNAGGAVAFLYGPTGQATRETKTILGTVFQTDKTYDRQGNMVTMTYPDASQVQYVFGSGGRIDKVQRKESGGAWTDVVSNFDYSPADKPTSTAFGNGASTNNTYDATKLYRLTTRQTTTPGGTKLQDLAYTYDPGGNLTRIFDSGVTSNAHTTDYVYDAVNRLTSASTTAATGGGLKAFSYDPIGNLTFRTGVGSYAYSGSGNANPHAVTSAGSLALSYDSNGDLKTEGASSFTWNYLDQLASAFVNGATSTFAYDWNGVRTRMTAGATSTLYAGDDYSLTAGKATKHLFADGVLLATVEGSTSTAVVRYDHADHLTGASVVTSATGTLVENLDYQPWGDLRVDNQPAGFSEVRKFAGHEYDVGTNLSYQGARYYDTAVGRFLSEDPMFLALGDQKQVAQIYPRGQEALLSDPQALNSYAYARNNPLKFRDLDGRAFGVDDAIGFAVGGFVGAGTQIIGSIATSGNIHWSETAGAFITGGIVGWGAINTPETLGASNAVSAAVLTGMLGGFYGDLTKQGIDITTSKQVGGLNVTELSGSGLAGAGTNGLLQGILPDAKIPGLSAGKNNLKAIGDTMRTKAANGVISNMSAATAVKSAVGSQAADAYRAVAGAVIDTVKSLFSSKSDKK
jgi:RHS repeat-associated protein